MFRDRELRLLTLARLASAAGGEATFFVGVGAATLGWVNSVFGLGMAVGAAALSRAPQRFTTLPRITALALLPSAHRLERPVPASPPEPVVPDVREAVPSSGELVG